MKHKETGWVCVGAWRGVNTPHIRQPENSKRAHLSAPALQTPPTFHEKDPQEREKKERKLWREKEKKSAKFFGPPPFGAPHPSGPHNFGAPTFSGFGAPHPLGPHHDTKNMGQKFWIGLAKNGLAKIGFGQIWSDQGQHSFRHKRVLDLNPPPPRKTVDFGTVDLPECQEAPLPKKKTWTWVGVGAKIDRFSGGGGVQI